jgi:hypothetical protein
MPVVLLTEALVFLRFQVGFMCVLCILLRTQVVCDEIISQ